MAATLVDAANTTYTRSNTKWIANTLDTAFLGFAQDVAAVFTQDTPDIRTVTNWLIPMRALASQLNTGLLSQSQFLACVDYVYRICFAASDAVTNSRITAPQGVAILAAWNARIGP